MTSSPPTHPDEFYAQLTMRNRGLIDAQEQAALRRARLVIAGCGSTGGACIMPLVRSGAEHFVLLDPGAFELDNLNRQEATLEDLGLNKAVATGARIRAVNPHATIEIHPEGVVLGAITLQLKPHDIVIDAVDVTSDTGVRAKLALHRAACDLDLKVITAYDIATTQYLELFDYSRISKPLGAECVNPSLPIEC